MVVDGFCGAVLPPDLYSTLFLSVIHKATHPCLGRHVLFNQKQRALARLFPLKKTPILSGSSSLYYYASGDVSA